MNFVTDREVEKVQKPCLNDVFDIIFVPYN